MHFQSIVIIKKIVLAMKVPRVDIYIYIYIYISIHVHRYFILNNKYITHIVLVYMARHDSISNYIVLVTFA